METGSALDVAKAASRMKQPQEIVAATMATLMALEPGSRNVPTATALDTPIGHRKLLAKDVVDPDRFRTKF